MIRGLYTAVSAMITNQQKQNVVVNNLANMDTNGYKSKQLLTKSFDELKLEGYNNYANGTKQKQTIGNISPGVSMDEAITNFNQGPIKTTDNKMDVAIQGKGFFLVSDVAGNQFYTRNGNFRTDNQGDLITSEGYYVLGTNTATGAVGHINVGNQKFEVAKDNTISLDGNAMYKFNIVDFNDYNKLKKEGDNLYSGGGAVKVNDALTIQSAIESSNVDMVSEINNMMTISREYEANQKIIQAMDSKLAKIASEIGSVR